MKSQYALCSLNTLYAVSIRSMQSQYALCSINTQGFKMNRLCKKRRTTYSLKGINSKHLTGIQQEPKIKVPHLFLICLKYTNPASAASEEPISTITPTGDSGMTAKCTLNVFCIIPPFPKY